MLEIKKLPDGVSFDLEFIDIDSIPESLQPHRHEYFEIFWVLKGTGSHSIDFVKYDMSLNQMFFITPGQIHDVHELPANIYAISFNAEFLTSHIQNQLPIDKLFLQNRTDKPFIDLDECGNNHLKNLIKVVEEELIIEAPDKDLISTLLVSFLRYLMRYLENNVQSYSDKDLRVVKVLKLIDEHFIDKKNVDFYSDKLAISSKRLNELTKNQFDKTVKQLVHDKVIVEARRLLAFTDKTVKTISYELGYQDESYFCRFFKRLSGVSPQKFREKWFNY